MAACVCCSDLHVYGCRVPPHCGCCFHHIFNPVEDKGCFGACSALGVAPAPQVAQALVQTSGGPCFLIIPLPLVCML